MRDCFQNISTEVKFLVTIDSVDQNIQDNIARGISVELVKKNLGLLIKNKPKNVEVFVYTVINRYNEENINEIKRFVNGLGLTHNTKSMGIFSSTIINNEFYENMRDLYPKKLQNERFYLEKGKVKSKMDACGYLKPVIGPTGDVTICCHDMMYKINTGNILESNSLKNIILSKKYCDFVEAGKNKELSICKECN